MYKTRKYSRLLIRARKILSIKFLLKVSKSSFVAIGREGVSMFSKLSSVDIGEGILLMRPGGPGDQNGRGETFPSEIYKIFE